MYNTVKDNGKFVDLKFHNTRDAVLSEDKKNI